MKFDTPFVNIYTLEYDEGYSWWGIMQTYLGVPSIKYGKGFDSVRYYAKVAIL